MISREAKAIEQDKRVHSFAWALIMETAASFEVASYSISDADAKKSAEGAIKYARDTANKYYTTPQQPQEQGELVKKAVADALEEAVISKSAYDGAMEDKAIWKKRALEAEEKVRKYDQRIVDIGVIAMKPTTSPPKKAIPEGWKPIDTAPHDEAVLVAGGDCNYPCVASWSGHHEDVWCVDGQMDSYAEIGWPTHWMPLDSLPELPAAPTNTEVGE